MEPYFPRVRDRDDIGVLRCRRSGVIFLDTTDHVSLRYYEDRAQSAQGQSHIELEQKLQVAVSLGNEKIVVSKFDDALRRRDDFGHMIKGRRWLDVGTGAGRMLDVMAAECEVAVGVEPNQALRDAALSKGHQIFRSIDDLPANAKFDVVTLFHVLEHMMDPVAALARLRETLTEGGVVIIEVPHARDFLLETADCDAFRRFTLWSEHLVLHTRDSLAAVVTAAGFAAPLVEGYQRYPLPNHLYWLSRGKPGGHVEWPFLENEALRGAYAAALQAIDQTDTLIAYASR